MKYHLNHQLLNQEQFWLIVLYQQELLPLHYQLAELLEVQLDLMDLKPSTY
jgi:hypothetical protein